MKLTEALESAERIHKQVLEDFFISIYDEKNLFSHGIDHHRRVWNYAKELLSIPLKQYNSVPSCSPGELIVACYLHDTGMSVDPGPRHGKQSREFCMQFLDKYNLSKDNYREVLDTIEYHDKKDYSPDPVRNDLLTVLSVADDLDAFGYAGVYRYSEIYLARGVSPAGAGYLILENAAKRFINIENIFGAQNNFVLAHKIRYQILVRFFTEYNKQAGSYNFSTDGPKGYCGVIQLFMGMRNNRSTIGELFSITEKYSDDLIISTFFNSLRSELFSNNKND